MRQAGCFTAPTPAFTRSSRSASSSPARPRTSTPPSSSADRRASPLLPRGAGTSLCGQAIGRAVLLDMSKYLNRVLEVNAAERWARIQPGVVLDELNAQLRPHNLWFAPDVSPSNRATLGGMLGNNSSGARSIVYGRTLEHVLEMTALLPDGHTLSARPLSEDELARQVASPSREGDIYRTLTRLVSTHHEEILARYPKILRRVGGYALDEFIGGKPFSLARLLVGSEGTLATTLEAKLNLEPRPTPAQVALMVVHFRTMPEALESTSEILTTGPTAVELADKYILDLTRRSLEYARQLTFVQETRARCSSWSITARPRRSCRPSWTGWRRIAGGTGSARRSPAPSPPRTSRRSGRSARPGWRSC